MRGAGAREPVALDAVAEPGLDARRRAALTARPPRSPPAAPTGTRSPRGRARRAAGRTARAARTRPPWRLTRSSATSAPKPSPATTAGRGVERAQERGGVLGLLLDGRAARRARARRSRRSRGGRRRSRAPRRRPPPRHGRQRRGVGGQPVDEQHRRAVARARRSAAGRPRPRPSASRRSYPRALRSSAWKASEDCSAIPDELQRRMAEFAEQMQGQQKLAWADNAIKLAVDLTVAAINRVNIQGTTAGAGRADPRGDGGRLPRGGHAGARGAPGPAVAAAAVRRPSPRPARPRGRRARPR